MNLTDYLKQKNIGRDSYTAISYYGKKISYGELFAQVDQASKVLSHVGVRKGDRILYLTPNIPETGFLWLGAVQLGAVSDFCDPRPDSLDMKANAGKILDIIKNEKISYIVSIDLCYIAMLSLIEQEMKEAGVKEIIILRAGDSRNAGGYSVILRMSYIFRSVFKTLQKQSEKILQNSDIPKNS